MSGGYFNHEQHHIHSIVDAIERVIVSQTFSKETLGELEKCLQLLKKARIYVHRIDYLLEGDDGEEAFHRRLKEDLENI